MISIYISSINWYVTDLIFTELPYNKSNLLFRKVKLMVCFKPFGFSEMVFSTFQYLLSGRLRSKLGVRREKVSCRVQYRSRTSHDQTLQMKIDFPKILLCSSGQSSNRSVLRGYLSSARFGQNHCFGEIRGSKLGQLREYRWQSSGPSGKDRQHKYPLVMLKFIWNINLYYMSCRIWVSKLTSPRQAVAFSQHLTL